MKTLTAFLIITAFASGNVFSQIVSYEKGQIITKNNDTIRALVELNPTYEETVSYKLKNTASIHRIKLNQIKSLEMPYNFFLNVAIEREDLLFRLAVKGNISLLVYSKNNMNSQTYSVHNGIIREKPPTTIYILRTVNNDCIINNYKEIEQIRPLLENCPAAKELVISKTFQLEDLEQVVNALNSCE